MDTKELRKLLGSVAARVEHDMGGYYEITVEDWQAIDAGMTNAIARAEKAEAEVVRLRAALDDAACALMRAGAALAEFEGFEKSMERAMRRAQDDCAAAFDAILPKKGQPMTATNPEGASRE